MKNWFKQLILKSHFNYSILLLQLFAENKNLKKSLKQEAISNSYLWKIVFEKKKKCDINYLKSLTMNI